MAPRASEKDAEGVARMLGILGYPHLRARAVADHVLIETGPLDDPIARIRLRKLSADEWRVELKPDSRWEKTHMQGPRGNMTAAVHQMLQWTLEKKR